MGLGIDRQRKLVELIGTRDGGGEWLLGLGYLIESEFDREVAMGSRVGALEDWAWNLMLFVITIVLNKRDYLICDLLVGILLCRRFACLQELFLGLRLSAF